MWVVTTSSESEMIRENLTPRSSEGTISLRTQSELGSSLVRLKVRTINEIFAGAIEGAHDKMNSKNSTKSYLEVPSS